MRLALRPYVTAGVAIVGASVIAVTPVTPTPTPRQAQSHAVQLSAAVQHLDAPTPFAALPSADALAQPAAVTGLMAGSSFGNPITRWMEVFETTGKSLTTLLKAAGTDPFPVLRQLIANQTAYANLIGTSVSDVAKGLYNFLTLNQGYRLPASLPKIIGYLAQGEILKAKVEFAGTLTELVSTLFPLLNLITIPYEISANITAVIQTAVTTSLLDTGIIGKTGFGLVGTLQTALTALATTGQALVDAGRAGDPLAALSAIVNAPAEFVDAVLNGIPNRFGRRIGGLLALTMSGSSWSLGSALLIQIPRAIAAAIRPPAPPVPPAPVAGTADTAGTELVNDVAALPSADTQTISLGSTPAEDASSPAPADETSGEAAETDAASETDTATEEETPETETPATDETDGTDAVDETEGSEETTGTDDSEESNGPKSPNGSTDLSGGNKAEPGKTGSDTDNDAGSGSSTDESASPTSGTNSGTGSTGTGAGTGSSTNDAGSDNDGSDGGSDS